MNHFSRLHPNIHVGQEAGDDGEEEWIARRPGEAADDSLAGRVQRSLHSGDASLLPASARPLDRPGQGAGLQREQTTDVTRGQKWSFRFRDGKFVLENF